MNPLPYTAQAQHGANNSTRLRLAYIDWMRGLACVLMFQTHCYDSWLGGAARQGDFYMYSQLGGTFPAPIFLFLAGISFALVVGKLQQKNASPAEIGRTTIWRGAEIFGYGLLFRLQEYVIAWGWAPKTDLLRVDVLNTIGVSMMLMGVLCWVVGVVAKLMGRQPAPTLEPDGGSHSDRWVFVMTSIGAATSISLLTPLLWTTWRPVWLPWPLESYVDGVHNLGVPQAGLFPLFPWSGFAFAGLAVGFLLQSEWTKSHETQALIGFGGAGLVLIELSRWLDAGKWQMYPVYDYWHTSPEFFLIRVGMLLVILTASYALVPLGRGRVGIQPLDSVRASLIAGVLGAY